LQFAVRFDIAPEQEAGPQLRRLGIGARDVKTVVLTHLHIDHDGGLAHFPHSRILASAGEIARTSGISGAMLGYLPKRWPKWFAPEPLAWQPTAYGPFASSARISATGDVIAVPTPGHTPPDPVPAGDDPHAAQRLRQSRTVGAQVTARESELLAG
jgi:N-acyl homoserine lactone hydrolase